MRSEKGTPADLVKLAREFAEHADARIGHRRKYHNLPYAAHLENVAVLVASVTDDPETLAAAWLHHVMEDTPAIIEEAVLLRRSHPASNMTAETLSRGKRR